MLDVDSAKEPAQVMAAVGLAKKSCCLRALVTEGIQRTHGLQARSLAISIGAVGEEIEQVAQKLREAEKDESADSYTTIEKIRENKRTIPLEE